MTLLVQFTSEQVRKVLVYLLYKIYRYYRVTCFRVSTIYSLIPSG